MVKGVAKNAVVVNGTSLDDFEQAIFISSGDQYGEKVTSAAELLDVARRIAGTKVRRKRSDALIGALIGFLSGSAVTAFIWFITTAV